MSHNNIEDGWKFVWVLEHYKELFIHKGEQISHSDVFLRVQPLTLFKQWTFSLFNDYPIRNISDINFLIHKFSFYMNYSTLINTSTTNDVLTARQKSNKNSLATFIMRFATFTFRAILSCVGLKIFNVSSFCSFS